MQSEQGDYVWHFKLADPERPDGDADAMTEMVRAQVEALLRCLAFTDDGKDVRVTGFRLLSGENDVRLRSSLQTQPSGGEDAAVGDVAAPPRP